MGEKRRVLLKLSGEAFGGGSLGVNPDVVSEIAKDIAKAAEQVEIAIVVGGGNFFRGAELSNRGMDRGRADYMGMLGTVMNALALQDFIEQAGGDVRVALGAEHRSEYTFTDLLTGTAGTARSTAAGGSRKASASSRRWSISRPPAPMATRRPSTAA